MAQIPSATEKKVRAPRHRAEGPAKTEPSTNAAAPRHAKPVGDISSDVYNPDELKAAAGVAKSSAFRVAAQLGESLFEAAKAHLDAVPDGAPVDARALAQEAADHVVADPKMNRTLAQALPAL